MIRIILICGTNPSAVNLMGRMDEVGITVREDVQGEGGYHILGS